MYDCRVFLEGHVTPLFIVQAITESLYTLYGIRQDQKSRHVQILRQAHKKLPPPEMDSSSSVISNMGFSK